MLYSRYHPDRTVDAKPIEHMEPAPEQAPKAKAAREPAALKGAPTPKEE